MAKKPIKVTEVVLRDAHQSLLATRMTMDEMLSLIHILIGMLMIPKTCAYVWTVLIGYSAMKK